MVYTRSNWLKPKPPVGSPDYDGEGGHVEVDMEDIEAERVDRWREEQLGK